jgi:predicted DNA-binding protein
MSVVTIRLPSEKHERLKALAKARGMSLNKLIEELSTIALAEFDAETRFRALVAQGDPQAGIAILDKLDVHFSNPENLA